MSQLSAYPSRYQLPELTAHLVAYLERRRAANEQWSTEVEASLSAAAREVVSEAAAQFREVAEDPAYWARMERSLLTVALPRYLRLAKEQHALEQRAYGAWRGGDVLSRAVYAGVGLLLAVIVLRSPIPDWVEPVPVALVLFGPFLPDVQAWWAKRRYAKSLARLVEELGDEQAEARVYETLDPLNPGPVSSATTANDEPSREDGAHSTRTDNSERG